MKLNLNQDISVLTVQQRGDLYRLARETRLAMQKEVDAVEKFEKALKASIIEEVPTDQGFVTGGYSFVVTSKEKPTIADWDKLIDYVIDNDRFDFFQKRLSDAAVMETADWTRIPGIQRFNHKDLSVTKR